MAIVDIITRILGIIGGLCALYLFFDNIKLRAKNKRLTIINVEKRLTQLDIQEEELRTTTETKRIKEEASLYKNIDKNNVKRFILRYRKELNEKLEWELRKIETEREALRKMQKLN